MGMLLNRINLDLEKARSGQKRIVAFLVMALPFIFSTFVGIFLWQVPVAANQFNTETSSDARSLGMGNATINTSRGPYSAFYNPANMASKETKTVIQFTNFQLEASEGLVKMGLSSYSSLELFDLYTYQMKSSTKNVFVTRRFSVYPNVTFRMFSVGMLYEKNQGAMVRGQDDGLVVKARNRFAPTGTFALRLLSGILRIGANVQLLTVGDADTVLTGAVSSTQADWGKLTTTGTGLSKNAGATVTLPFTYLPSFSFVARDIGRTTFSAARVISFGTAGTPTTKEMTFDFASALTVYLGPRVEMKGEFDYRDLTNRNQGQKFQHMFFGGEITFFDTVHFRAGMAHGYWTGGFGIGTNKASLDFAAYSEERGYRLRDFQEQRYVVQYSWGLFK